MTVFATRASSLATVRQIAARIDEGDPAANAARLLEKVAQRDDAEQLRAALAEHGALALVHPLGGMVET